MNDGYKDTPQQCYEGGINQSIEAEMVLGIRL